MPVAIIDTHWPLVYGVVVGDLDDADLEKMYDTYERIHMRKERFFLAQETRRTNMPTAVMRKKLGELNLHFGPLIENHVVAINVVVPNRIYAGALKAIWWFSKEWAPSATSTSAVEMVESAKVLCEPEGLVVPPSAMEFSQQLDKAFEDGDDFLRFVE